MRPVLKCPRDGSSLNEVNYESDKVGHCPQCGGIWCDDQELGSIVESLEKKFGANDHRDIVAHESKAKPLVAKDSDSSPALACLRCGKPMRRINYAYNSGVIIDRCHDGHGVWLDRDEIERIQVFVERCEKQKESLEPKYVMLLKELGIQTSASYDRAVKEGRRKVLKMTLLGRFLAKLRR